MEDLEVVDHLIVGEESIIKNNFYHKGIMNKFKSYFKEFVYIITSASVIFYIILFTFLI